jgi:membrane-associated phospholipid phosphatase
LPHNALGEVTPAAYGALLLAIKSRLPLFFERIPMGCAESGRRLVNPQAGLAFDLQGADSHHLAIPPAPAFASAETAAEMAELYWMALARDVPFSQYDTHPITNMAAEDLSRLSGFYGPRVEGRVTPSTLFRGLTPGDLVGPYISQFLCRPVPFGSQFIEPRMRSVLPGIDYMTNLDEFLAIQNGCPPALADQFDETRRFVLCGRDLAQWVHVDVLFQAYFNAAMILLAPLHPDPLVSGIGAPYNSGNPYLASANQEGFGTFGPPALATLVCEVATRALKAVWYQKWFVHRRLRPEEYGGRVHQRISGAAKYPIHRDLLNSAAPAAVYGLYGTWLLPQAFPEGSPLHPSYGAGHATVAGACVTILKAFFDESYVIPNPLVPHPDNPAELIPYEGPPLTVGGELNKLAASVAQGRNFAGIHWRTDYSASVALGEAVAISVLLDQRATCNEEFDGYTFTRFDGTTMTV